MDSRPNHLELLNIDDSVVVEFFVIQEIKFECWILETSIPPILPFRTTVMTFNAR